MFPTLKWLNSTSNKLFTIDTDTYTLFRLVDKKKDKDDGQQQLIVNQVNSRPASLPIAKQEQVKFLSLIGWAWDITHFLGNCPFLCFGPFSG
jgi:hypothetical protein